MSELFRIERNDVFGRYLVAKRTIKQGELILKEEPTLLGPLIDGCLICFKCSKLLKSSQVFYCAKCEKAIVCSPHCTGPRHADEECNLVQTTTLSGKDLSQNGQIITVLRCLLLFKYNPALMLHIMELEHHLDKRKDTTIWRKYKTGVEDVLKEYNVISKEDIDSNLVQKICGILDVNTFEVRSSQNRDTNMMRRIEFQCLRGLYLKAALMAHDCVGNTHIAVDDNYTLSIHASVDIPENAVIYFNYANALQGTYERKRHLRQGKYFECSCRRCNDPTEMQTESSTLICPKCRSVTLRATKPGVNKEPWKCYNCGSNFKYCLIKTTLRECRRRISEAGGDVKCIEKLLIKLLLTLSPRHYLILELKQNLVGAYTQYAPSKENLMRKIELCEQLLSVFKIIEPGISRMQAITLYELHSAKVNLAHKLYTNKEINAEEFISRLLTGERILKDSIKFLLYEPVNSPEGILVQNAMKELKMLRNSISQFQHTLIMQPLENKVDKIVECKKRRNKNKAKK